MFRNQVGTYRGAARTPNIGPKIPNSELNKVVNGKRAESAATFRQAKASTQSLYLSDTRDSSAMMRKGSRPRGSMAGYKGGRTSWIQMNGSGYQGASRATRKAMPIGRASTGMISAAPSGGFNKLGGRMASSSKSIMSDILKLGKLL